MTGFGPTAEGQSYTMFYPDDAITPERALDRLREADADGWALDESRLLRADGSAFWGSVMIAPLPSRVELVPMSFSPTQAPLDGCSFA